MHHDLLFCRGGEPCVVLPGQARRAAGHRKVLAGSGSLREVHLLVGPSLTWLPVVV